MSSRTWRTLADFLIFVVTFLVLYLAGAKFWALIIVPFAVWNYYDGLTRARLS